MPVALPHQQAGAAGAVVAQRLAPARSARQRVHQYASAAKVSDRRLERRIHQPQHQPLAPGAKRTERSRRGVPRASRTGEIGGKSEHGATFPGAASQPSRATVRSHNERARPSYLGRAKFRTGTSPTPRRLSRAPRRDEPATFGQTPGTRDGLVLLRARSDHDGWYTFVPLTNVQAMSFSPGR